MKVTFTHPSQHYSPCGRYHNETVTEPALDPYRFIHRKLGLTAMEFEERVTNDIDEMLAEIERERRQALLETLPFERVLSKEDCRQMFRESGAPPPTSSLLGVYRWAMESTPPPTDPAHGD